MQKYHTLKCVPVYKELKVQKKVFWKISQNLQEKM